MCSIILIQEIASLSSGVLRTWGLQRVQPHGKADGEQVRRKSHQQIAGHGQDSAGQEDLYCGAGTITQVMARRAARVIGAEIVPEAIADARENARRNGIENVEFFCGDAAAAAADFAAKGWKLVGMWSRKVSFCAFTSHR